MRLEEKFIATVMEAFDADGGRTEVLPALLAQACVGVLPFTGAGLSFTDELRIPLGASDQMAVRAERLQTTLGEGPCLAATALTVPLRASGLTMATRWPMFHRELLSQTSYRSIVSIPLHSASSQRFGALDLYSDDDSFISDVVLEQVSTHVAEPIAAILFDAPKAAHHRSGDLPSWLASDGVMDRMTVWIAIGMVMEKGVLTNAAALATLRGYAFAHDTTLDELAGQLNDHHISTESLLG